MRASYSMPRTLAMLLALCIAVTAEEVALTSVNVVTMEGDTVLKGATVLVRDGRIAAVGKVELAAGTRVVDCGGRWLIPGLSDMHVHNWYEEEHILFVAHGVTRVRNMWGTPLHLKWRKEIAERKRIGPAIVTTGPILDGAKPIWEKSRPVTSPEQARAVVKELKAKGYDSIKVYNRLRKDVYRALLMEAQAQKIRVVGHVPTAVGLVEALRLGQSSIEHLEGYLGWPQRYHKHLDALVDLTAQKKTWNCPTLVVLQRFVPLDKVKELAERTRMRYVPPRLRATWDPTRDFRTKNLSAQQFEMLRKGDRVRKRLTKTLYDASRRVLMGTDCGNPFVVAGWSAHDELANLVAAGLTPYEALACATTHPARYLGDGTGAIKAGEHADLVLLDGDPLDDIANTKKIAGVMLRGRWFSRADLDKLLAGVVRSYETPKQRFKDMAALPEGEQALYRVTWNGLEVGEERFSVTRKEIVAQRVNDPPWGSRSTVTFAMDVRGFLTKLTAVREDDFGRREVALKRVPGVFYGFPSLATWLSVERYFRGLEEGESDKLAYHELTIEEAGKVTEIAVEVRRDKGRQYTIWMKRPDATYKSILVVDEKGWPVTFTTPMQQGTVKFERVK